MPFAVTSFSSFKRTACIATIVWAGSSGRILCPFGVVLLWGRHRVLKGYRRIERRPPKSVIVGSNPTPPATDAPSPSLGSVFQVFICVFGRSCFGRIFASGFAGCSVSTRNQRTTTTSGAAILGLLMVITVQLFVNSSKSRYVKFQSINVPCTRNE